jgi:hypothetical protein
MASADVSGTRTSKVT